MRAFVASVLGGARATEPPPAALIERGHLGPLAYRLGVAAFRDEYAASVIMAERRRALLGEMIRAFARDGLRAALIKGSAFVGTIYPDPAERPMNDIDLLVPRTQLPAAMRAMLALGFERVGLSRKLSGYYHAIAFARAGMMVELHRNIVGHGRTGIRIGEVWRRAVPDPLGSGADRLEPLDELLICAVHIARHELAVPVINYVDVARLWARLDEPARLAFRARARVYRVERACAAVLAMTELLARGERGAPDIGPGSAILPTTDDVLRGGRPRRLRQIGQKLLLVEGPRELVGLAIAYGTALADGLRRGR